MNSLNFCRSDSACRSTTFSLSPTFSTRPSGSYSRVSRREVWPPPTSSKSTAPAFVAPSVAAQATRRSGTCSRILASHCLRTPPISATHSSRSSLSCVTLLTPPMKCGNSSNWVHWLYAVLTGTFTRMRFSTFVLITSPSLSYRGLTSSENHQHAYQHTFWTHRIPELDELGCSRRADVNAGVCPPAPGSG